MLTVISPAKRLDWSARDMAMTQPAFLDDALTLARAAKRLSQRDLQKLMDISPDLARLNAHRFKTFETAPDGERPAALAFAGDTYIGLEAASLDADALAYAQDRLRILSGLYGLLRPLDAIEPYRLEMGTKLPNPRGRDLYQFWGSQIADYLNTRLAADTTPAVINLASQEYFKALDKKALKARVVDCVFEDFKDGQYKIISFYAKRARGLMTRFATTRRLSLPAQLKDFNLDGYAFAATSSSAERLVFRRQLQAG